MLMQNDPFFEAVFGGAGRSEAHRMPMDAYRRGNDVWVHLDLPGIASDSLDISVERNVLTVTAERSWQREDGDQMYLAERPRGGYRRQVHLGESLNTEDIEADLTDGVLTLRIPVSERAQPRKISVGTGRREAIDVEATST